MKKIILTTLIFLTALQAQAFEDVVLATDGKVSNLKIEDNSIINVYPLATIQNEKNILFIIPIKNGKTMFSLMKNETDKFEFEVDVKEDETIISERVGFEAISLDEPPEILDYEIDLPPVIKVKKTINIDGANIEIDSDEGEANG